MRLIPDLVDSLKMSISAWIDIPIRFQQSLANWQFRKRCCIVSSGRAHSFFSSPQTFASRQNWPKVAWTVTWINRNEMEVGIGLRCPRGMYLILYSYWSGSDTGRRFLACSQVKESCGFNYWIDQDCVRRDQRVFKDLLSIKWTLAVLYPHSAAQCEWYVC